MAASASRAPAPLAGGHVSVEELRDRGAISALRDEWERLVAGQGPFLTPAWLGIYAASLADEAHAFRLLVAHRDGRLVGALPLVVETRALAGAPARILRSLSDDHSQRFDVVLAPGPDGDAAARALVAHLARARDWDALELQSIMRAAASENPRPSNAARLVAAAHAAGMPTGTWPSMTSPYLTLPATPDALDKQLDAKFRGNLRRRAKKLAAAHGPVSLERIDGSDGKLLDAALDEGFALEAAGWKGELGTAIACDARLRRRYGALAHAFAARGQLACYFLRVGDKRIAFHFALVDSGTYYLFKPGFDPSLATFGIGHLLVDFVARDLIARGVRELDFLGDDMPWKREWTDRARAHDFVYVFAPSLRGRALARWKLRLVPALKRLAAGDRVAPLRRLVSRKGLAPLFSREALSSLVSRKTLSSLISRQHLASLVSRQHLASLVSRTGIASLVRRDRLAALVAAINS